MGKYAYRARDGQGHLIEEELDAGSRLEVEDKLRHLAYIPIEIKKLKDKKKKLPFLKKKIKLTDLALMFRQMATMINAGLPIVATLAIVAKQTANPRLEEALNHIRYRVEAGAALSEGMFDFPEIFSQLHVHMVKVAEESGLLGTIFDRLALIAEHEKDTKDRVKSATRYPKIVVLGLAVAFVILMSFVVPRFAAMYSRFKVALPLPTRIMIDMNYIFQHFWWAIIAAVILGILGVRHILSTKEGRRKWDTFKLRAYIFGPLMLKISMSRFCRILAMMIRSGVPIIQALQNVGATMENVVLENTIKLIEEAILEGKSLAEPMTVSRYFPDMVVQMVSVGEQTGQLDELLEKSADYYDREIDYTIQHLAALLEPMLLLGLAIIVLFFALAIYLPMWDVMSLFRH
ncbi:MAG: type II secretion system F family protein [Acidobacteria bacterium]|nr:type II secretion system F family protein [Acidobacteriota bacterium]